MARGAWPGTEAGAPTVGCRLQGPRRWGPPGLALRRPLAQTSRPSRLSPHYTGDTNGPRTPSAWQGPALRLGGDSEVDPMDPAGRDRPPHPRPSAGPDGTGMCGAFCMSLPAHGPNRSRDPTARASELTASPLSRGGTESRGWGRPVRGGCPPPSPLTRHAACALDPPAPRSRRADRKRKREPFQGAGPLSRNVRC